MSHPDPGPGRLRAQGRERWHGKSPESELRACVAGPRRVAERERDQPPCGPEDVAESSELTGHLRYPGPRPGRGGRCRRLRFAHRRPQVMPGPPLCPAVLPRKAPRRPPRPSSPAQPPAARSPPHRRFTITASSESLGRHAWLRLCCLSPP